MAQSVTHVDTESGQRVNILKLAAALFAKKGYAAVGVAEIGEVVQLGRGALYYHIGSKEQLLFDIVMKYISSLVASGNSILEECDDPEQRVQLLSRCIMNIVAENLSELKVCFREADALTGRRHQAVSRLHAEYQGLWAQVLAEGARKGVFRPVSTVALKGLLGMYFHSFLWLNPKGASSAEDIAATFADIVLRAVRVEASSRAKVKTTRTKLNRSQTPAR